jgi:hypothetical protein
MSGGRSPDYIREPPGYRVVRDPDPIAGFSPGSLITREEHKNMLVYCSYTAGTILIGPKGALWKVVQTERAQELRPIKA